MFQVWKEVPVIFMIISLLIILPLLFAGERCLAQQDSIVVKADPSFNDHGAVHRLLFGKNYREEWAADTKVPIIRLSTIKGGLTPTARGGGHQSRSLRLKDKQGREWVIRSVNKYPEVVIPEAIRNTFAKDWVKDHMSAQHPYAALVVAVLANATGVPHANPIIGWLAPDPALGEYAAEFANTLVLLEEREPLGKSDNSEEMFEALDDDSENKVLAEEFLRAQLLDVLIGDWDRHPDQWRWRDIISGKGKAYLAVPRDRDQVFYVNQGLFPSIASTYLPYFQGWDYRLRSIASLQWESRVMATRILSELSYEEWMQITRELVKAVPDSVFHIALRRLPEMQYNIRHKELFAKLQSQRRRLIGESEEFYHFLNRIVEVKTSDKNEEFYIKGDDSHLTLEIHRLKEDGRAKVPVFRKVMSPKATRQLWLYTGKGTDNIFIDNSSPIKIKIVADEGIKHLDVQQSEKKLRLYAGKEDVSTTGNLRRLKTYLSGDTSRVSYMPINRYSVTNAIVTGGYNRDDGLLLGLGVRHKHPGFRKVPFSGDNHLIVAHSFSTNAFQIRYAGTWTDVLGRADIWSNASFLGPNNTINFYGRGNETRRENTSRSDAYYRARFDQLQIESGIRWDLQKSLQINIGGMLQFYRYNRSENVGRFINSYQLGTSDNSIAKDKMYAGIVYSMLKDKRSSQILPASGMYWQVNIPGFKGLNNASRSFMQIIPELRYYRKLTSDSSLVVAERIGGGVTFGKTAFYQSLFLGGHDNLYGFHQYRFAGQHLFYNNLDLRVRLARINAYILPGELGINGFYDIGRVWEEGEKSTLWHYGYGGGVYFSPANYAILHLVAGHSKEGWYPYFRLKMRF